MACYKYKFRDVNHQSKTVILHMTSSKLNITDLKHASRVAITTSAKGPCFFSPASIRSEERRVGKEC